MKTFATLAVLALPAQRLLAGVIRDHADAFALALVGAAIIAPGLLALIALYRFAHDTRPTND